MQQNAVKKLYLLFLSFFFFNKVNFEISGSSTTTINASKIFIF